MNTIGFRRAFGEKVFFQERLFRKEFGEKEGFVILWGMWMGSGATGNVLFLDLHGVSRVFGL